MMTANTPRNVATFASMVNARVESLLKDRVEREANEIVRNLTRKHGTGELAPQPAVAVKAAKPKRIRNRPASRRQFAPKDSWLALAPRNALPKATVSGQLASAVSVADAVLATGAAERRTLTALLVEANAGWTNVTASSCISRLVAAGRLVVVNPPIS